MKLNEVFGFGGELAEFEKYLKTASIEEIKWLANIVRDANKLAKQWKVQDKKEPEPKLGEKGGGDVVGWAWRKGKKAFQKQKPLTIQQNTE